MNQNQINSYLSIIEEKTKRIKIWFRLSFY
jgi:hypothetical protein